jgi:L-lactate dehydrogenase complex protein LldF
MASKSLPMFPQAAKTALANSQLRRNLGKATTTIRNKRASVVSELPDWESLRTAGSTIKAHVMHHLDEYLLQLEAAVQRAGGQVHWARDAAEANRIITEIVQATGVDRVVKVKCSPPTRSTSTRRWRQPVSVLSRPTSPN